jgi:hypothetical protein
MRHAHPRRPRALPLKRPALRLALLAAVLAKLLAMVPAHAAPPAAALADRAVKLPKIRLAEDGWGTTPLADLQALLAAVALEMGSDFPGRSLAPIQVVAAGAHPMVLYERGQDGEYVVHLSARDGRWYQFVYQFAHELCHIYSNYDNKPRQGAQVVSHNQWFEEALCETAALYTLRRLANLWETDPQAGPWAAQAPTLRQYADLLVNQPHRSLPAGASLPQWFRENRLAMAADPYLRHKDEVVANILLPLFEQNPRAWGAIAYLNADRGDAALDFEDYLEAWCLACPDQYRPFADRILALFKTPGGAGIQTAATPG